MTEPRPAHSILCFLYALALWGLIIFGLIYYWQPVFQNFDMNQLDGGQDEIRFVN